MQVREQAEFTSDGYDVVVINKTLTSPGIGPGGAAVPLLEKMAKALRRGGSIVWLVGNGLSIRRLVGAQTPTADQMTRVRLERALEAMGFEVDVLSLFPSTLNARVLIADSLFERAEASLTWRLPRFPRTVEGHSTRGLWRTLSEEGVGPHFETAR